MKRTAIIIAAALVPYAITAFTTLDFSVVSMDQPSRFFLALFTIWAAGVGVLIANHIGNSK